MKTIKNQTAKKARFYVTAVSTALAGTKHRSTVRKVIGAFDAIGEAQGFAEAQARRPEVKNANSRIRFEIGYRGRKVARVGEGV